MNQHPIILIAQDLYKSYAQGEVQILSNLSLTVRQGETLAIMGPSGVGKSTLLNILGTLETPTQGFLEINGINVHETCVDSLRNHHIGFVFQSYHLLEEYTALDNVLMPARIARLSTSPRSAARARAVRLLEQVGMSHRTHFLTKFLSGGEKQRIALARALCNDPSLILADEPTGNLDEHNSTMIHQLLIQCAKKMNKGLIVVTHNQELANLCDHRFLLKNGVLQSTE
jgi:lipoprotein-releasing system ATP-binding protein